MVDGSTLALIFIFIGTLARTVLPYLRKLKEDGTLKFDLLYLRTMVFSFIVAGIATLLVFPAFELGDVTPIYLATTAFTYGYAQQDIINEIVA